MCRSFSLSTVLLIAIDRCLHIKYLHRYSINVTKKRGCRLLIFIILFQILMDFAASMPFLQQTKGIVKLVYLSCAILSIISVIVVYYKTMKAINNRVLSMQNPPMQSTMAHSKAVMNAALAISICMALILIPYIIGGTLSAISTRYHEKNSKEIGIFKWFAYLTSLANGACSCIILIVENRPVKRLLRGMIVQTWAYELHKIKDLIIEERSSSIRRQGALRILKKMIKYFCSRRYGTPF